MVCRTVEYLLLVLRLHLYQTKRTARLRCCERALGAGEHQTSKQAIQTAHTQAGQSESDCRPSGTTRGEGVARSQHFAPGRRPCPSVCNKLRAPCATDAKGLPNPLRPRAVEEYLPGLGLGVGRRALPILSFRRGRSRGASGVSGGVQALAPAVRAF